MWQNMRYIYLFDGLPLFFFSWWILLVVLYEKIVYYSSTVPVTLPCRGYNFMLNLLKNINKKFNTNSQLSRTVFNLKKKVENMYIIRIYHRQPMCHSHRWKPSVHAYAPAAGHCNERTRHFKWDLLSVTHLLYDTSKRHEFDKIRDSSPVPATQIAYTRLFDSRRTLGPGPSHIPSGHKIPHFLQKPRSQWWSENFVPPLVQMTCQNTVRPHSPQS